MQRRSLRLHTLFASAMPWNYPGTYPIWKAPNPFYSLKEVFSRESTIDIG